MPTTFQGGVNFYIGNNSQATGTYQSLSPGKQVPAYERTEPIRLAEKELGRQLEPYEVSNFWLHKSLDWAKKNPADFLKLQVKKTRCSGVGMSGRIRLLRFFQFFCLS